MTSLCRVFVGNMSSNLGIMNPACRNALKTQISVLHCPSDPSVLKNSLQEPQLTGTEVALTSYKGVIGDTRVGGTSSVHDGSMPECTNLRDCPGMFWRESYLNPVRFDRITDGLSNTLMVGEDVPEHNYLSAAFYSNSDWASCNAH